MNRSCIGCGQVDDHPRHIVPAGDTDVFWHHDCHATTGCEVCEAVAAEGLKGDELREHIVANDPGGEAARRLNDQAAIDAGQMEG